MMWESFGEQETAALGRELAAQVKPGDILLLEGDLGVGKTVFAKGFAEGLGITEPITSPTFTLIQEYEEGRLPLYHFDVYRIADEEEMYEIGYESYFFGQGVCLIEWASRIPGLLPDDCRTVRIQKDLKRGFDYRRIELVDGIALLQGDE
ncbi:MAG: tRNA (adenosine(37)-N6)-threonylcarbamoyltransferase complex ATPase subunit type 1 TsaE [Eubacterium sp.]|nr:tRNA (adenosine(37)-N6)-threonylcarbamoyltransferase complex ATPase subunit type 1 TsaE [Eubacterium sp.]